MKRMIWPSASAISFRTAFRRSSNSPRYFEPASRAPMSRLMTLRSRRLSGMSPETIRCARPSTIAVLPTPGSPISTGLFLVRRQRTWMTRRISSSRPMTGSSLPSSAACVRSRPNFCSAWYLSSGLWSVTRCGPRTSSIASGSALCVAPLRLRTSRPRRPGRWCSASRMCSVEMYSSLSLPASRSARRRTSISSRLVDGSLAPAVIVGELVERVVELGADRLRARAELAQHGPDDGLGLVEQRDQQVLGLGLGVMAGGRHRDGGLQRLLGLDREAVGLHVRFLNLSRVD